MSNFQQVEMALRCSLPVDRAPLDRAEHVENEIADLQQRLDSSEHEQRGDVWRLSRGFNKLPLAAGLLFRFCS